MKYTLKPQLAAICVVAAFTFMPLPTAAVEQGTQDFGLTPAVNASIGATATGPVLRMSDRPAARMEQRTDGQWHVPELDLSVQVERETPRGAATALVLTRYQETVRLSADQDVDALFAGAVDRVPEVLDELLPRLMIVHNVPGASLAGVKDGQLAWTRTYGVTAAGSDNKVNETTMFEAASMSKPAVAYAVLRMVDRGEFDLDRPLVEVLGEPYARVVSATPGEKRHKAITARMVFQHQTGFPNWRRSNPLVSRFEPGTGVRYSGEGFLFLQRAIERQTGKPLEDIMRKEVLDPLGMRLSSYVWESNYPEISSEGHNRDGIVIANRRIVRPGRANAAFSLYTTPSEYALFLIDVMGRTPGSSSLLNEPTRLEMLNPTVHDPRGRPIRRAGPTVAEDVYWALSWRMQETSTGPRYSHGGSNRTGFRCMTEFDPAAGDALVIMTNAVGGATLRTDLIAVISRP